jgi:hypothetical protein
MVKLGNLNQIRQTNKSSRSLLIQCTLWLNIIVVCTFFSSLYFNELTFYIRSQSPSRHETLLSSHTNYTRSHLPKSRIETLLRLSSHTQKGHSGTHSYKNIINSTQPISHAYTVLYNMFCYYDVIQELQYVNTDKIITETTTCK